MQDWQTYANHFTLTRERDPAFLTRWMDRVADVAGHAPRDLPAEPWLDAGAGTGRFCSAVVDHWDRDVVALEPQPVMVAARDPHPRVQWVQGSAVAPPFPDRVFAGVWLHLVLHMIDGWADAVRALAACVADGGLLAVRTFTPDPPPERRVLPELFPEAAELNRRRWMAPAAVAEILERAGLRASVQPFADETLTPRDTFMQKLEGKSMSVLQLIDESAFTAGLARARARYPPGGPPVREMQYTTLVVGVR